MFFVEKEMMKNENENLEFGFLIWVFPSDQNDVVLIGVWNDVVLHKRKRAICLPIVHATVPLALTNDDLVKI